MKTANKAATMMQRLSQQIMRGKTMHWRRSPEAEHRFTYPVLYFSLPVTQNLSTNILFKRNQFSLYSFYDKDHGSKHASKTNNDLITWFYNLLSESQQAEKLTKCIKHIHLITQPRVLGFVFNPVSFWMCYDQNNKLIAVLAEVNNTFGTRLSYLLTLNNVGEITQTEALYTNKSLYVSPFFEIKGCYEFKFNITDKQTHIRILYYREHSSEQLQQIQHAKAQKVTPTLVTTLDLTPQAFTRKNLATSFVQYGFSTIMVVSRIHWQALKLKIKGAKFYSTKTHIRKTHSHMSFNTTDNTTRNTTPNTTQEMQHEPTRPS